MPKKRHVRYHNRSGNQHGDHKSWSLVVYFLPFPPNFRKEKPIPLDRKRSTSPGPSSTSLPPTHWFFSLPPLPLLRFPRCDFESPKKKKRSCFLADSRARASLAQNLLLLFPHLVGRNGVIVRR